MERTKPMWIGCSESRKKSRKARDHQLTPMSLEGCATPPCQGRTRPEALKLSPFKKDNTDDYEDPRKFLTHTLNGRPMIEFPYPDSTAIPNGMHQEPLFQYSFASLRLCASRFLHTGTADNSVFHNSNLPNTIIETKSAKLLTSEPVCSSNHIPILPPCTP